MTLKRKVLVTEVEKPGVYETVEKTLQSDPKNAYTVQGIMVEKFNVPEEAIHNKSFGERKRTHNTLYGRVYNSLEKLVKAGKAKSAKHEKARVYWWAGKQS